MSALDDDIIIWHRGGGYSEPECSAPDGGECSCGAEEARKRVTALRQRVGDLEKALGNMLKRRPTDMSGECVFCSELDADHKPTCEWVLARTALDDDARGRLK